MRISDCDRLRDSATDVVANNAGEVDSEEIQNRDEPVSVRA
jgi:hypothetical protein